MGSFIGKDSIKEVGKQAETGYHLYGMDALKPHTKMGVMVCGGASDATSQVTIKTN